jgi:hypothetical protein
MKAILHAANIETETGLQDLQDALVAFEERMKHLNEKKAKVLQGRLDQAIVSSHAEHLKKCDEIKAALADQLPFALEDSAFSKLSTNIQALEEIIRAKSDESVRLKRETELLERERPEEKHGEAVVQAAIADQNRKLCERYAFPDPNERLAHSAILKSKLADLARKKERRAEMRVKAEALGANRDRTATLKEDLSFAKTQMHHLKHRFEIDGIVLDYMGKARDKALDDLLSAIPLEVASTLSKVTGGKYTRVLGAGFDLKPWSDQKDGVLEAGEMSAGTLDQFYLALRLEALRASFPNELPPFILDDVLVSSDVQRRSALIAVVGEYSPKGQVIYLTCHDWPELARFHQLII